MSDDIPSGVRVATCLMRADNELTAPEVMDATGVARSSVYRTLSALDDIGAVDTTKDGRSTLYSVTSEKVDVLDEVDQTQEEEPETPSKSKEREPEGYLYGNDPREETIREYANDVVYGDEWPLGEDDVDLSEVVFVMSFQSTSRHGQAGVVFPDRNLKYSDAPDGAEMYVEISENTYEADNTELREQTIRHELVHVSQYQKHGDINHGDSFREWVDPLNLTGRTTDPLDFLRVEEAPDYFNYPVYCRECDELRYSYQRMCRSVHRIADGIRRCNDCDTPLHLMAQNGALLRHNKGLSRDEIKQFVNDNPAVTDGIVHSFADMGPSTSDGRIT